MLVQEEQQEFERTMKVIGGFFYFGLSNNHKKEGHAGDNASPIHGTPETVLPRYWEWCSGREIGYSVTTVSSPAQQSLQCQDDPKVRHQTRSRGMAQRRHERTAYMTGPRLGGAGMNPIGTGLGSRYLFVKHEFFF